MGLWNELSLFGIVEWIDPLQSMHMDYGSHHEEIVNCKKSLGVSRIELCLYDVIHGRNKIMIQDISIDGSGLIYLMTGWLDSALFDPGQVSLDHRVD